MPDVNAAPTGELGVPGTVGYPIALGLNSRQAAGLFGLESYEETPELRFPMSAYVYDRMRRTDGQVGSVLRALTLPVVRTEWRLDDDGVRPDVAAFVRAELGLDETADGRRRRRREGVVWRHHVREALLMLPFGFYPFEQVYEVGPPSPGQAAPAGNGGLVAHLRKLAPRPPRTLEEVIVARDGGLAGVAQLPPAGPSYPRRIVIPVDRLVYYVNEREGADWYGSSILRTAYPSWLIKDRLRRLGPMVAERNGMGVPVVTFPEGGSRKEALDLATAMRAGETAGAALPTGYTATLLGVTGTTKDELPLLKYHDEEIGRSVLAMVLNLGHDNGARSLGDTFLDLLLQSLDSVIDNVAETATEHIIRDLVELNYGPDEAYPLLAADPLTAEQAPTADALKALVEAGLLTPDGDVKADVRRRFQLPAGAAAPTVPPPAGPPVVTAGPAGYDGNYPPATLDGLVDRALSAAERLTALKAAHGRPV